jgi:hypothetical protein
MTNKLGNPEGFPAAPTTRKDSRSGRAGAEPKPNLDSFETLMRAMDTELARSKSGQAQAATYASKVKGKGKATVELDEEEHNEDIEAAMEAELKDLLDQNVDGEDDGPDGEIGTDYNLIKNFLESFKSQAGLSGPVGNLAGRLEPGWTLPRDGS